MSAPGLDVDKEAVKTLAIAIGVREAARQTGLSEDRVRQWSCREKWFKQPDPVPLPPTITRNQVTAVTKPSDALRNHELALKGKTRLNMIRWGVNASKVAAKSRSPLSDAPNVKALASVVQVLWPEQQQPSVSINLLNAGGSMG